MNILFLQGPNLNLLGIKSINTKSKLTLDKLNTAVKNESKELGKIQLPNVEGNILFNNVSFKFIGESKTTLNKINCQIEQNSFIGIVGKSGSGKSTF